MPLPQYRDRTHPQMCFELVQKDKLNEYTWHIMLHLTVASVIAGSQA